MGLLFVDLGLWRLESLHRRKLTPQSVQPILILEFVVPIGQQPIRHLTLFLGRVTRGCRALVLAQLQDGREELERLINDLRRQCVELFTELPDQPFIGGWASATNGAVELSGSFFSASDSSAPMITRAAHLAVASSSAPMFSGVTGIALPSSST